MSQRLDEVSDDANVTFFLRIFVYPKLLKAAGRQLGPVEVVNLVETTIGECVIGVPEELTKSTYNLVPKLIDVLVTAKEVAAEAKMVFGRNQRCSQLF